VRVEHQEVSSFLNRLLTAMQFDLEKTLKEKMKQIFPKIEMMQASYHKCQHTTVVLVCWICTIL
jgi:hypothetical protein